MAFDFAKPVGTDLLTNSHAQIRANWLALMQGWLDVGEAWSYASATTITVPSDATTKYSVGMKVRITQATGGTKYFFITVVAATLITVVGVNGAVVNNEAISSPCISTASLPLAFPMQKGALIQLVFLTDITARAVTSASMVEVSASLRLAITPKLSNSLLRITAHFCFNPSAITEIFQFKFYDVTNAVDVGVGTVVGSRTAVTAVSRVASFDVNDPLPIAMSVIVSATNTTARTYTLYAKGETAASFQLNQSTLNTSGGWNAPFVFTIEEIAQ